MTGPTVSPAFADLEASVRLMVHSLGHDGAPARGVPALVLDLGDVQAPTASGLGQLVALHNRLRESGGRLVLCNVGDRAYEAFEVARLTELLDVRRRIVQPAANAQCARPLAEQAALRA